MEKKEFLNEEMNELMFNETTNESVNGPNDFDIEDNEFDDYDFDDEDDPYWDDDYYREEHYEEFAGTYAQECEGYSDEYINDAFDGFADAYWNID